MDFFHTSQAQASSWEAWFNQKVPNRLNVVRNEDCHKVPVLCPGAVYEPLHFNVYILGGCQWAKSVNSSQQNILFIYCTFSVAKVTLHLRLEAKSFNSLKSSFFIIHHSSFFHPSSFFHHSIILHHSSFILPLICDFLAFQLVSLYVGFDISWIRNHR